MKATIKKITRWIDDRSGISEIIRSVLKHPVPPGSKWAYVFGSATLFCFILQIITGIFLALMYQPSSDKAYASLQYITHEAPMGNLLRGIHYFGASGMIIMVGIHMLRVYITAAYKFPREMNWISGIILLILTMAMGFTGQLLRWDDSGLWSAVVAAEQLGRVPLIGKFLARLLLGGDTLGGHSLSRFFAYHVFLIPGLMMLFISFHLWLVIRNGISEPPKAGRVVDPRTYRQWYRNSLKMQGIPFWPYAAWRDVVFSSVTIIIIFAIAAIAGPPALTKPPDPSIVNTAPQPDWYLSWIYALFALMPPQIESYVIFFGPLLLFFLLFALPFFSNKGERSPVKRPWAIVGSISVVIIISSLLVTGAKADWSPAFDAKFPSSFIHSKDTIAMQGNILFQQKACLSCHRIDEYGGNVGPDLSHVAARLNRTEMEVSIVNGSENMPAYGRSITSEELNQLLFFLMTKK